MGNCAATPDASMQVAGGGRGSEWRPKAKADGGLSSVVELHISGANMPKLDLLSHSDPFAVLYVPRHQATMVHDARCGVDASTGAARDRREHDWVEVGRTERLKNCVHPHFTTSFVLDFAFEERQPLLVEFYDSDKHGCAQLSSHDYIGAAQLTVADVVGNSACQASRPLRGADGETLRRGASCTVTGEEVAACANVLHLKLRGSKLANHDGPFGLSDPYLDFCKSRTDDPSTAGTLQEHTLRCLDVAQQAAGSPCSTRVFHTEVVMNSLDPRWAPLSVPVQTLCNGDTRRAVRLNVWDWEAGGEHDFMGATHTTVEQLLGLSGGGALKLVDARGKACGAVIVDEAVLEHRVTFLDYLHAGLQMPLTCAIDFTASNRNGADGGGNLHARHAPADVAAGRQRNDYQQVICAIAPILNSYSVTPVVEAFGFGAKLKGGAGANHQFVLSDVPGWPVFNAAASPAGVTGTAALLTAYDNAIASPNLKLYGPTNFAPTLRRVRGEVAQRMAQLAQYRQGGQMDDLQFVRHLPFTLVLIITDGIITDLTATKDEIVRCSHLPISVVIVGVGRAQFHSMIELDADQHALTASNGEVARRDIVQFVSFNDFHNRADAEAALARESLAELPQHVMEYMAMENMRIPVHVAPIGVEEMQQLQMGIPVAAPPPPMVLLIRSEQAERGKLALGYALQGGVTPLMGDAVWAAAAAANVAAAPGGFTELGGEGGGVLAVARRVARRHQHVHLLRRLDHLPRLCRGAKLLERVADNVRKVATGALPGVCEVTVRTSGMHVYMHVGVVAAGKDIAGSDSMQTASEADAWLMQCMDGTLWGSGHGGDGAAGAVKDANLTLRLDAGAGTLRFLLDGVPHGPGFDNVRGPVRLFAQLGWEGNAVRLLSEASRADEKRVGAAEMAAAREM
jgi:hypothetical protein